MIKERIKFYADTPRGEKNKFFSWAVTILTLEEALFRFFEQGFAIRAAWYEKMDTDSGETENTRLDVQREFDKYWNLQLKKKIHIKGHFKRSN